MIRRLARTESGCRRLVGIGSAIALSGVGIALSSPLPAGAVQPTTTTYATAGEHLYTVPAGATALNVTVVGATASTVKNGKFLPGAPGLGAVVKATIPVPTGTTTFYAEVGDNSPSGGIGGGGPSPFGGAGGGSSDLRTCSASAAGCTLTANPATDPRLVVAGGGGGGGEDSGTMPGGAGGSSGASGNGAGAGGAGAFTGAGGAGAAGAFSGAAGAAGADSSPDCAGLLLTSTAGSPGQGGTGSNANNGSWKGGGGGGGWNGGGGGGASDCADVTNVSGGGGGGGSSFTESTASTVKISSNSGDLPAEVTITPVIPGYDLVGADGGVFVFPLGQGGFFGSL